MKQITAIIADDEENLRTGLCLLLERLWPELKILGQAQNGIEALSLIELEKPDIAFLDIQMPGMNGIETLRQMKMENPTLPVILSSAYNEYKQDFGAWASDEYVVKSSNINDLKEAVRKHLS